MDHLSTPGSTPAAFASHPLASVTPLASGADAGHETSTKANYQDALLFIAPPLLSAAVLGALSVNLHRIPSAHPLADASLLCAGAAAILITAWWFISFIYALFYARSLRVSSRNADRAVLQVPAIFRPRFMRRIVLTLGGTALGVGAVLAPAQATVATPSNAGLNGAEGIPQTTISAVMAADSSITAAADASSDAVLSDTAPNQSATPLTLSAEVPNIPLAPEPSEAAGYLQDRSPFFSPPRTEAGTYSYTVQAGDTLWSIAADQLGEGTDASTIYDYTLDIYEANKDALGQNAELLYEGQVLQIPEQPVH
ncbi:peptidoglycan-binding protein LysM [Rothia sp. HMSC071B01]|uniref:LysM peptidoglycan-binding domain-containing protein n=1 Tax=unclassified Rothia (in: high G+C Gram-positive bacteria) TaxID=2689056 RepID=UPI0008A4D7F0|nr:MULTISPECIES: LysM peptidoglycan-binding domain-containing protein [unclassified Rothia (in: high G+C Gram-positive bacteria)]OFN71453.1 peptidoglycan-binding protein LysM [Rothia sp. HMSC078H08]OFN72584.1 peptidoglycan-binding protein LysM [Rothia sp. HMSC071B01]OFP76833.1 peptidoglycan-binding protein LysM [Rothia sp. HMSC066G07]